MTPREAARIQSFPDTFQFPVSRTHQLALIGNAVPPLVGKNIGCAVLNWLSDVSDYQQKKNSIIMDTSKAIDKIVYLLSISEGKNFDKIARFDY